MRSELVFQNNLSQFQDKMLKGINSIHFIGIGGIGMSGLAKVMFELDYRISGSDIKENNLIDYLKKKGIKIYGKHDLQNIKDADLIVISSAILWDNPELNEAKRRKIPIVSRGEFLSYLVNAGEGIVVAGTHGKTTTTSLIASLLLKAGKNPTIFIGGELSEIGGNSYLGTGRYVVAESDESDGSFLFLHPKIAVLTNLEDDHLEYYGSQDKLNRAFKNFSSQLKSGGTLIVNQDNEKIRKISQTIGKSSSQNIISYGLHQGNLCAEKIKYYPLSSSFQIKYKTKPLGEVNFPLPGEHNIYNCLAALLVGIHLGISWNKIKDALSSFRGVKRRFEVIGEARSVLIVDDYAHHPTEIKATLKVAQKMNRRIIAIFQPHRYTRTRLFLNKFPFSFQKVDILILTQIYEAGEHPTPGINGKLLFEAIKKERSLPTYYLDTFEEIIDFLMKQIREKDLVITMGAGNIREVGEKLLTKLNCS